MAQKLLHVLCICSAVILSYLDAVLLRTILSRPLLVLSGCHNTTRLPCPLLVLLAARLPCALFVLLGACLPRPLLVLSGCQNTSRLPCAVFVVLQPACPARCLSSRDATTPAACPARCLSSLEAAYPARVLSSLDYDALQVEQTKPRLFILWYVRSKLVVQPQHCHGITQIEETRESSARTALSTTTPNQSHPYFAAS